ncbi:bifunctional metallophosphatase/5'-nucleotidase [Achromobacter aloeverae]|uniref:Bifunctional metallophosphatase/5'-nucleotidase n=1 Tax=Achromobacter aloeverae TaxID=1750518 RepID=A0A4Q1HEE3_9BURK|nr:5'-nucleotidase C-terminal domain-containing protein [Achromobacter aloeverae]RXN84643.1 bifunctional metallophosphatase/5'-nucleotidase [Achromobacter aloeverae]
MKYWKRHALAAALASVLALLAACNGSHDSDDDKSESGNETPPAAEARALDLTILHINDHHSNLDGKSKELTLKNAAGSTVKTTVSSAGFPRVKAAIDELAAQSTNVLKLHAGDALTGTLYFNRAGEPGEADAALMDTVCFDAMTLGNHEFDKGDAGLKQFIGYLHAGACKTPVLSANVTFGAASPMFAAAPSDKVLPYTIVRRDDQPIGIIGVTIAGKTKQSSSPDPHTNFSDEATAVQVQIDALRAQGVDKIVLLSHIGYDYDKEVIARLSGVDVVVGGDSHTLLGPDSLSAYNVGTPQGSYPTPLRDKDGKLVCLVQAWEYAQVVGELKVSFDKNGDVTACAGRPHVLIDSDFKVGGAAATVQDKAVFLADAAQSGFLRVQAPDAGTAATLQPFKAKVDAYSQSIVATVPLELCRRRVPGTRGISDLSNSSATCNAEGSVNTRGGDIQQLVAQAYLDVANEEYGGADITLQSGGGVRIALTPGTVTAAKVIEVLPFGNMLWRLDVTAAEVKSMLEDGMQAVFGPGGTTGPYPYAGGLRWDTDSTQTQGNRVSNIEFHDRATSTWMPLDPARTYKLFVLSFNATGGDGYKTLTNVPAARRQDIGVLDADVFQTYIDMQPKDSASGLPILDRLPHDIYSTKSFIE